MPDKSKQSKSRCRASQSQAGGMISRDRALSRLRESGARMTAQRRAVLDVLEGNRTHPTAEDIIARVQQKLGDVSPATIYNTLESLEKLGLVRRLDGLEQKAHFDPDTSEHQHAICRNCKRVFDVSLQQVKVPGFSVEDIVIHGLCHECLGQVSNQEAKEKGR